MNKIYYNILIADGGYKIVEQSFKPQKHGSCEDTLLKIKWICENNLSYRQDASDPYSQLNSITLKRKLFKIADEVSDRYDSKVKKVNFVIRLFFNFSKKILPLRLAISRLKGVPSLESIRRDLFHLIVRHLNVRSFLQLARTNRALYSRCKVLLSTADLTQFFKGRVTFKRDIWCPEFDVSYAFDKVYNNYAHFRLFVTHGTVEPAYKKDQFLLESLKSIDPRVVQFSLQNCSQIHAFEYAVAGALHKALVDRNEDIACLLLDYVRVDAYFFLEFAVYHRCTQFIEKALRLGWYVNLQNHNGNTPLFVAVHHHIQDIVDLLMRAGADPLITNKDGHTALDWAARYPNILALIQSPRLQRIA